MMQGNSIILQDVVDNWISLNLTDNTNFHPSPLHPFIFKFFNLIFFFIHMMASFSYQPVLASIQLQFLICLQRFKTKIPSSHILNFQNLQNSIQILDKPAVTYLLFLVRLLPFSIFTYNQIWQIYMINYLLQIGLKLFIKYFYYKNFQNKLINETITSTSTDPFAFAFNPQNIENTVNKTKETLDNPLFEIAYTKFGKKFYGIGDKYDSFLNSIFSSQYRFYFDVDNIYVVKKSIMTLAPYLYGGNWTLTSENQAISPTENIHAPDLYLPLMSLVTFVLLRCLSLGINDKTKFSPGYIVDSFWKCLSFPCQSLQSSKQYFAFQMELEQILLTQFHIQIIDIAGIPSFNYQSMSAYAFQHVDKQSFFINCHNICTYLLSNFYLQNLTKIQPFTQLECSWTEQFWVQYNIIVIIVTAVLFLDSIVLWLMKYIIFNIIKIWSTLNQKKNSKNQSNRKNHRFNKKQQIQEQENEKFTKQQLNPVEMAKQGGTGKIQTEIQYDLVRLKRLGDKIEKKIELTYRQKIETFNKKIKKMPEHYDIPKVGPG